MILYDMIYLLTASGLPPGDSNTVHIYTQTHRTTQNKRYVEQHKILEECGPCPIFAIYTLAFALQLRKKHGKKTSKEVRKNPNHCIPLKPPRQFYFNCFNTYCVQYHIRILIPCFLYNIFNCFNQFL
jgi:hypothetical protein